MRKTAPSHITRNGKNYFLSEVSYSRHEAQKEVMYERGLGREAFFTAVRRPETKDFPEGTIYAVYNRLPKASERYPDIKTGLYPTNW